jgi:hypothetical protein
MKQKFYAAIDYVKNLFPGCAPVACSNTAYMDARVLSKMALRARKIYKDYEYTYWECKVKISDVPVARYIMRSNGVSKVSQYNLSDNCCCLSVRADYIKKDPDRMGFITTVMNRDINEFMKFNDVEYQKHLLEIRQRMK